MAGAELRVWCDGSCPKPHSFGGYAFMFRLADKTAHYGGGYEFVTTNQRMELQAALAAMRRLEKLKLLATPICITSDSAYLVNGMMRYISKWRANDYTYVKNPDLWCRLDARAHRFAALRFEWVKGHAGVFENEYVDRMAAMHRRRGEREFYEQQRNKGK